jgi:predicted porin
MQRKILAAALFATAFPIAAFAQSNVQMYGVMDAALSREETGTPGQDSTWKVNSGNQSSSRIGFRGTEDLGDGLKAMFNIEAGVAIDTGAADSNLFQRRAVVGLENNFGLLTIGREYSPIAMVAAMSDVFGQGFYGSNLSAFGSQGANRLTRRLDNSVNLKTSAWNGLRGYLAYSAGEKTTDPSGDLIGGALEYNYGNLGLSAGYHTIKRLAVEKDKEMAFGAAFKFDALELKGNYLSADNAGPNNKFKQYNVGAAYTIDANKFFFNFQQNKSDSGAKGKAYAVAYSYSLSKRTNLYASYATMDNNNLGVFALNSSSTNVTPAATALGADPKALSLGLRHTF